jgi:hypothetical protein
MTTGVAELGEVIAERRLELHKGSRKSVVTVLIGRPVPEPDSHEDWACPFQIKGLGDEQVRHAIGADSAQALMLCLQMVGAQLHHLQQGEGVRLGWLRQKDLGFPTPASTTSPARRKKKQS